MRGIPAKPVTPSVKRTGSTFGTSEITPSRIERKISTVIAAIDKATNSAMSPSTG